VKEYLDRLDELLSDESKWTQCTSARDSAGNICYADSDLAVSWCLAGAIRRIAPDDYTELLMFIYCLLGETDPMEWNDAPERTFADVKALIAKAKERAVAQTGETSDG